MNNIRYKVGPFLVPLLLLTSFASAAALAGPSSDHRTPQKPLCTDPVGSFITAQSADVNYAFEHQSGTGSAEYLESLRIIRITGDFNNDGIPDMMLASTSDFGNAVGSVKLYLGDAHGGYHDMGWLDMNPAFMFTVTPRRHGSALLVMQNRSGFNQVNQYGYLFTGFTVKNVPARDMPTGSSANDRASARFYCRSHDLACTQCRWQDWREKNQCDWQGFSGF